MLTIGAHDRMYGKYISQKNITMSAIHDDTYHVFDMGKFTLDGNTQLFIATVNNSAVETVYVDRIILLRNQ